MKVEAVGVISGVPNFQRRHMAKIVSATGQKNMRRIANELTSASLPISKIADQTSK